MTCNTLDAAAGTTEGGVNMDSEQRNILLDSVGGVNMDSEQRNILLDSVKDLKNLEKQYNVFCMTYEEYGETMSALQFALKLKTQMTRLVELAEECYAGFGKERELVETALAYGQEDDITGWGDDMDENMTMWGRIADTAITALKEQISRLQKERDKLETNLVERCNMQQKGLWSPVSDPPIADVPVLVCNTEGASTGYITSNGFWITKNLNGEVKYWMPIPKLPELGEL
jgi:hypothetical protein